jgi:hypothetical protein
MLPVDSWASIVNPNWHSTVSAALPGVSVGKLGAAAGMYHQKSGHQSLDGASLP